MTQTKKLVLLGLFVAIGYVGSLFISIPLGIAKVFPVQHFINVMGSCTLGPFYSMAQAFITSTLRIFTGTGTILAYPGSMIGAFLSGLVYIKTKKYFYAVIAEVIGTGIIAPIVSVPLASLVMHKSIAILIILPGFFLSSLTGAIIAYLVLKAGVLKQVEK